MPGALLPTGVAHMQRAAPITGARYTLVTYLRMDAIPGDSRPVFVAVDAGLSQYEGIEIRSSGVIRFHYVDGAGYSQYNTFVSLSLDTWWAFGMARDGDDLFMYAREEGGSTQAWSVNTSQASRNAWSEIRWRFPVTSHNEATGYQLTRLFDEPLSQSAIEAEWDSATPVNTTDLIADWEFENDGTDATRRNDAFATYDLSGTSDTDWGASDLPAVFGSGATYADGTAYSTDGHLSTAAPAAHVAVSARSTDDAAATAVPAAHIAASATSLDHQSDTGTPALYVAGAAYSLDQHAVYAGPALHIAALATSTDGEAARAALAIFASALASSTDGALAAAGGALHLSVLATSADADLVSAALSAAVSALASSSDGATTQAAGALLVSALATSLESHVAHAVGALLVHGVATSIDDALAVADLAFEAPEPSAVSYQTRSVAFDTMARSSAVDTTARSAAA